MKTLPVLVLPLALFASACGGPAASGGGPTTGGTEPETASTDGAASEPKGARPPDFELPTLTGDTVRLSDHLGKDVVLLDFWATFCDPCLTAMPHLDEVYKKHKDEGFVVLGISIDGPDSIAEVKTTVAKLGVSFPILLDQETSVVALYNPKTSAPYSVLIGRDGSIITKKEGYTTGDSGAVERDVEAALAKK
ncbi:MAG: TlpA family protein disulfide reductase [Myxococcales bacterium]|nr:TlpA family protein disulfide reductase [Myxococcales bacterium]MCB9576502.1 TlpA family protein disulfide reductase [Polyangiaceae bacterium]